jgi:outer membrane protein TolC
MATPLPALPLTGRTAAAGTVVVAQPPVAGTATSVNTLNPSVQVQGTIAGSIQGARQLAGVLSLGEAIQRGLDYNLSAIGLAQTVQQARGERIIARSALMPEIVGDARTIEQRVSLAAAGVRFDLPVPGFSLPQVVGPFSVIDVRARLSQALVDSRALNTYRAARETLRATELSARDARDLIVLAVGGAYLQAVAARARIEATRAQVQTATALYERAVQQRSAGLATPMDVNRAEVQRLAGQQRLVSLQADLGKQKIALARLVGLPARDEYELAGGAPLAAEPALTPDEAVARASAQRSDLKAGEAQVRAAERALAAAQAGRLPSLWIGADYGTIGSNTTALRQTFSVTAALRVPIWEGGLTDGQILQAQAVLRQRRAELDDLKADIEGEVRRAFLDLQAARSQLEVAERNVQVSRDSLDLARQRFDAGVGDNLSVVQSQELVAAADLDRINGVYAHGLAKLDMARAIGGVADNLAALLPQR